MKYIMVLTQLCTFLCIKHNVSIAIVKKNKKKYLLLLLSKQKLKLDFQV